VSQAVINCPKPVINTGASVRLYSAERKRWHELKAHYATEFDRAERVEMAQKLRDCDVTETLCCCANCGSHWYVVTKCRQRTCPICSYKVAKERASYLHALTRNMQHPKLVTLTMAAWKGSGKDGIVKLRAAFAQLRKSPVFEKVRGGAYTIELECHPDYFHIHMHILLDAPFIPYQHLFSAWREIINQDCPQVDIRSASNDKAREYICKYASKSPSFKGDQGMIVKWYDATFGQRLFATFGTWYNAKINDLDQNTTPEPLPVPCPFCGAVKGIFHARDGPYIYGGESWNTLKTAFVGDLDLVRPMNYSYIKGASNSCKQN
jgi:hypothetical protein